MKKNVSKQKNTQLKKNNIAGKKANEAQGLKKAQNQTWSLSIYVYWFIILFFIAATFYILGRSHSSFVPTEQTQTAEITEEVLLQANDYYESGKTKLLAGNVEEAITDLNAAIEAGNKDANTYILRGEAYMQIGNYRQALIDFNTVIEQDNLNAVAYYDRALLNMRLEDYDTALSDINNALAAQTEKPSSILQMRDLYAKRGQLNLWAKNWDGAIADYTNSLARQDGKVSASVYAERAEAYTAKNNYVKAINDYASAIRVISEQIEGVTTAADREQLSSQAMSYFEKSAALNIKLNDKEAARNDLQSAYMIASALMDKPSMERIEKLLAGVK